MPLKNPQNKSHLQDKERAAAKSGIFKRALLPSVRKVTSQGLPTDVAQHLCLELRVDQSCSCGVNRERYLSRAKRRGLGTQRGVKPKDTKSETV